MLRRLPARAAGHAGRPGHGPLPRARSAAAARPAPGLPADRRRCRRRCCRAGPAGRCGCRGCRVTEATLARAAGEAVTRTIRWALPARPAGSVRERRHAVADLGWCWRPDRRAARELLAQLGLSFTVVPPDVDETPRPGERPSDSCAGWRWPRRPRSTATRCWRPTRSSRSTATSSASRPTPTMPGACCGRLSGRAHRVHTGVAVRSGEQVDVDVVHDGRHVRRRSRPAPSSGTSATGEPFDKAGAYAIQGAGGVFVERVRGSVSNVVGLPLTTVVRLLRRRTGCERGLPSECS